MIRLCLWLAAVAVALVPPAARLPTAVVRDGASADYFTQSFGCAAEEAAKAEKRLRGRFFEGKTRAKADELCSWLQSALSLSDAELKKMVLEYPTLLSCTEKNLASTLDWLRSNLDLSKAELKKLVRANPRILGLSIEANMAPKVKWLQSRLDLSMAELRKVLLRKSQVFSYNVEANLAPAFDWLQSTLNLRDSELKKLVVRNPSMLGYTPEARLANLEWL